MFKRQVANQKGNAMIEFALVAMLLLGILGGAIDFGLAFFVSHVVQNATREGARLAVSQTTLNPGEVVARVQERLPSFPIFDPFRTDIATTQEGCDVTVRVNGTSPYFFLRVIGISLPMAINRTVTMRYEHSNALCP